MTVTYRSLIISSTFFAALLLNVQPAAAQPYCPPPATGAFTGCYFSNISMTGNPIFIRTDNQINFTWGKGSPDVSLPASNFSVRWKGTFIFDAGVYTFSATASDGIRLYLDGTLILDRWLDQTPTMYAASRTITAGSHLIAVEYYDYNGTATAQVSWKNSAASASAPAISSFTAAPSSVGAGQTASLSWNVSGATALTIDNGVGDVSGQTTVSVSPAATTTYTLTATNSAGSTNASATVTITAQQPAPDTQPPAVPTLISAVALNAAEVDLTWLATTDNTGVAGYTVLRNGSPLTTLPGTAVSYADTTVSANTTYTYSLNAFDKAGNFSTESNRVQVTTPGALPPAGSCPAPATNAFTGCYYSNMTLSGNPVFVRTDPQINFYWGNSSPDPSLPPLNFSARWQGNFQFTAGNYNFNVITSDGMRLYVDGVAIIDRWRDQSPNQYRANLTINAGVHLVVVEYYEHLGGATAQVSWQNLTPITTAPATAAPVISSFTATPASGPAGQPINLAWNVSGATTVTIDQGIGSVTGQTAITVRPVLTTTYTLIASNATGTVSSTATVTVAASGTSLPTAPTLLAAMVITANEADLAWSLSSSSIGIAGYQILRNGVAIGNVPSSANSLFYADTSLASNTTYSYAVRAYDPAGNYSAPSNSMSVTTPAGGNVSVTWYGACWQTATIYGVTGQFQAMDFGLVTPTPVPLQGTLFFAANCDSSNGTDNMNDFNALTPSTHMIQGFSFHPNEIPTSALFWIGGRTADGRCAPGAPCSACVNYNQATPKCENMP